MIALGLAAAAAAEGIDASTEELLAEGVALEGHADNLAAALCGGVCLTSNGRVARVADDAPAVPIVLVPDATVSTASARAALPTEVSHDDATFTATRAALLGAALASGSSELFTEALDDRLHEPYRAAEAPMLAAIRKDLPRTALGATLSGSGPSVVVWARRESALACAQELESRFPEASVLTLNVTPEGAHSL